MSWDVVAMLNVFNRWLLNEYTKYYSTAFENIKNQEIALKDGRRLYP